MKVHGLLSLILCLLDCFDLCVVVQLLVSCCLFCYVSRVLLRVCLFVWLLDCLFVCLFGGVVCVFDCWFA